MKKLSFLLLVLVVFLVACTSNDNQGVGLGDEIQILNRDLTTLQDQQEDLIRQIQELNALVDGLEKAQVSQAGDLEDLTMDMKYLFNINNLQDVHFVSYIGEAMRLSVMENLREGMYLVESFDFETLHISVKDRHDVITSLPVSEDCKVLVAGQDYMIYQTLTEGRDFIASVTKDEVHKVILVLSDDVVEQIRMYGSGPWWPLD